MTFSEKLPVIIRDKDDHWISFDFNGLDEEFPIIKFEGKGKVGYSHLTEPMPEGYASFYFESLLKRGVMEEKK